MIPPPSSPSDPIHTPWEALAPSSVLVMGERGHPMIDRLEERGVLIARRSFAEARSVTRRFELAVCLDPISPERPLRMMLALLASCAETFAFADSEAVAPTGDSRSIAALPAPIGWAARRRTFIGRTVQEFGFSLGVLEEGETPIYYCHRHRFRPMLAHVHLPKTGGISLRQVLEQSFPGRCLPIDADARWGEYGNPASIHTQLLLHPHFDAVGTHLFRFGFPNVFGDRLMLYFTLLREPVEQFKSCVRFVKYNYSRFNEPVRRFLPARIPELTLAGIADTFMADTGLDSCWFLPCRFLGLTNVSEPVIRRLMGFLLVGIFERMEDSLVLLGEKLRPYGLELKTADLPHLNSSRGTNLTGEPLPGDHAKQERELEARTETIRAFIKERMNAEFEVYEWARTQFEEQWQARKVDGV